MLVALSLLVGMFTGCHGELHRKDDSKTGGDIRETSDVGSDTSKSAQVSSDTDDSTSATASESDSTDVPVVKPTPETSATTVTVPKPKDNKLIFDKDKNYSITFWAKNDTNLTQVNIYNKAIADFEKLYPNIDVTIKLYTDYGRIYSDVITNIQTGTTPNVCITYPDHIATYMTGKDTMVSLDKYMFDSKYGLGGSQVKFDSPKAEEIVPKFLAECTIGDEYYALPFMRSTEACYVNKTYVEKLGYTLPEVLTWDFVWEVSEAATKKNADGTFAVNGKKVMIPFIYKSTDNMMIQMLAQKNAGYSTYSGEVHLFNDTTMSILDTIAKHAKSKAFSTFKISSYPANHLNAGQCIFAVDSTAGATWMGADAPLIDIPKESMVDFETEVMMIPQFDPTHPEMISQGPSVCVFNKADPGEVTASWLFAQYLLTNEVQLAYSSTEGYVPVTLKAQNSDEYKEYMSRIGEDNNMHYRVKLEAAQLLLDNVDNTFVTPVFNGSASLRNAAGELIEETVKAVNRKKDIDHLKTFESMISRYKLDQIVVNYNAKVPELNNAFAPKEGETAPVNQNIMSVNSIVGNEKKTGLPTASVILLASLGGAWVLILVYLGFELRKKSKKSH